MPNDKWEQARANKQKKKANFSFANLGIYSASNPSLLFLKRILFIAVDSGIPAYHARGTLLHIYCFVCMCFL